MYCMIKKVCAGFGSLMFKICCSVLGEFVAQFKFTVLLMPNGPLR